MAEKAGKCQQKGEKSCIPASIRDFTAVLQSLSAFHRLSDCPLPVAERKVYTALFLLRPFLSIHVLSLFLLFFARKQECAEWAMAAFCHFLEEGFSFPSSKQQQTPCYLLQNTPFLPLPIFAAELFSPLPIFPSSSDTTTTAVPRRRRGYLFNISKPFSSFHCRRH